VSSLIAWINCQCIHREYVVLYYARLHEVRPFYVGLLKNLFPATGKQDGVEDTLSVITGHGLYAQ